MNNPPDTFKPGEGVAVIQCVFDFGVVRNARLLAGAEVLKMIGSRDENGQKGKFHGPRFGFDCMTEAPGVPRYSPDVFVSPFPCVARAWPLLPDMYRRTRYYVHNRVQYVLYSYIDVYFLMYDVYGVL